jgi:6-methylsalicylic acid synthase
MACRTAGGNDSPEKLWQFLLGAKDASGEVPRKRWEPWLRRDVRNAKEIEKTISKGYFIDTLENFDASFFGISPKEAEQMDPHQRLALELSWEALEDAGIDPKSLSSSDTAVYMGVDSDDYSRLLLEDIPNIEAWMGIGTAAHGVSNRVSYHLDLMGPSTTVDAACASSLVAVHMGCQSILNDESQVAIVGGVNVLLAPSLTRMLGKAGALSPEGICRSFDDSANGYARGEGGAVLILKKLSAAILDGDSILATLKGSAVAQDGKTNGIMAPNAKAQELVSRQALSKADIDPLSVGFVEAHATSTPLGDPVEISAISAVYGNGRPAGSPVHVGSIKPNVGHLEAAAGAISLIKAVLSVNKGQLAPQAHLNKLNSRVDWENSGLEPVREITNWSQQDGPRRAAVCSYGYGGTVSHAIVEEFANEAIQDTPEHDTEAPVLLTLSAPHEKRLRPQAKALSQWLSSPVGQATELSVVANTLTQRRAHHDYRVAFVAKSHDEVISALDQFVLGSEGDPMTFIQGRAVSTVPSIWVFSGHGAQWKNMGRGLLQNLAFCRAISDLDAIIQREAGISATEILSNDDFDASERVQILTYVIQVGLSQVLQSMGIKPLAIIGHSVGEIAASVVGGCLTAEEGALIVTRRAKLYSLARGKRLGGMALVGMSFEQAEKTLGNRKDLVAAINSSPTTCVVSGTAVAVEQFVEDMEASGVRTFRVKTDVAFHSPMLEELELPLRDALAASIHPQPPRVPVYSTSNTNPRFDGLRDIDYWVNNMISPVQLQGAVRAAAEDGYRVFVEVSSHPIVLHSINEIMADYGLNEDEFATIPTMKRNTSTAQSLQMAVAQLYVQGAHVDFKLQFSPTSKWSREVPGTQWMHQPYYKQVEAGPLEDGAIHDVDKHTLLGSCTVVAGTDTVLFKTKLDDKSKPFPGSHPLDGTEIIPAAVYINTFHHATGANFLSDIKLKTPVSMGHETRNLQIVVNKDSVSVASSAISQPISKEQTVRQTWVAHSFCQWTKLEIPDEIAAQNLNITATKQRIGTMLPSNFAVDYLSRIGVAGIAFPWEVIEHYGNADEMIAKVDMDPTVEKVPWDIHSWAPMLDAATSVGSTIFFSDPKLRIVSQIDRVWLVSKEPLPKIGYLYIEAAADAKSPAAHVSVLNEEGDLLAKFHSMRFSELEDASRISGSMESLVHRIAWVPPKFSETPRQFNNIVLVSGDEVKSRSYAQQLQSIASGIFSFRSAQEVNDYAGTEVKMALGQQGAAIVYIPTSVELPNDVASFTEDFIWQTVSLAKFIETKSLSSTCKLFVVTNRAYPGSVATLAHQALYGLARIIASEHPDLWGGLLDTDKPEEFPSMAAKYVQGQDIVRIVDGLPRCGVMRPLAADQRHQPCAMKTLLPKPEGTYVVTGGLGDFGLETCGFLVEKGARRIVTISRSGLPPRHQWTGLIRESGSRMANIIERVQGLEKLGATIHALPLDITAPDASRALLAALEGLGLPPVLGVVHAAGILEDSLLMETTRESFARVLAPKVSGALALHEAFPPNSLDFFVLYSSIGQLVGTAGQASYGSGNAFLDGLATYRRAKGDNAVAFQFTALRGMGMAKNTDFLAVELQSKGITDISCDEAFRAWEHVSKYDIDSAVVTHCIPIDDDATVPIPLLEGVVLRRPKTLLTSDEPGESIGAAEPRPTDPQELEKWLNVKIRECIASVLLVTDIDDIDPRMPVADLGVDSVMTVALREKLQSALKIKVPSTLTWNHPTVNHLVLWFAARFGQE